MPHIEILNEGGLKCDAEHCTFEDKTIPFEEYPNWINAPCPECGENLLTQEDYNNAKALKNSINLVNSMSEEQLKELTSKLDMSALEDNPMFAELNNYSSEENLKISVSTHKNIKITNIESADNENKEIK